MSTEKHKPEPEVFWEAELSEADEKLLREDAWYYSNEKAELQSYLRLMKRLKNEKSERAVHFLTPREIKLNRRKYSWMAAAVVVMMVVGIQLFIPVKWPQTGARFEMKDPDLAIIETKKALLRLSEVLNEGKVGIGHLKKLDEIKQEISKHHE
jgi:hypothetical protein